MNSLKIHYEKMIEFYLWTQKGLYCLGFYYWFHYSLECYRYPYNCYV